MANQFLIESTNLEEAITTIVKGAILGDEHVTRTMHTIHPKWTDGKVSVSGAVTTIMQLIEDHIRAARIDEFRLIREGIAKMPLSYEEKRQGITRFGKYVVARDDELKSQGTTL